MAQVLSLNAFIIPFHVDIAKVLHCLPFMNFPKLMSIVSSRNEVSQSLYVGTVNSLTSFVFSKILPSMIYVFQG